MYVFIGVILLILSHINYLHSSEAKCSDEIKNIKATLITDEFYKYEDYLHYALGNYTNVNDKKYRLEIIDTNTNIDSQNDLIFGDYLTLKKIIDDNNIEIPKEINYFYNINGIENKEKKSNLHPLDLDTFILISKNKIEDLEFEEDLYNFNKASKYTLSQSFISDNENIKFLNYLTMNNKLEIGHPLFEKIIFEQRKKYSLLNKNTFLSNYNDLLTSYLNDENIFYVKTDGFAYKEKKDFIYYPNNKKVWNAKIGKFIDLTDNIHNSFFGFSAVVNNEVGYNFLCYLIKPANREMLIKYFDLGISPLSIYEISDNDKISEDYRNLLLKKNKNIKNIDIKDNFFIKKNFSNDLVDFIANKNKNIIYNQNIKIF